MSWFDLGPDVPKDKRGGFATVADILHGLVHMGCVFEATAESVNATFDTDTNVDIVIETGDKEGHFFWEASAAGGRVEVLMYQGPTVTDATGTAITPYNKRKASAITIGTTFLLNPTVTATGTQTEPKKQIFGSTTGVGRVVASTRGDVEINLFPNTKYLLRFTAKADNILMSATMQIYERTVIEV